MLSPIFELKDISFRYNPRAPFALKGVNLRLHAGEIFGLVGESGSGKTTLGRCVAGACAASGQLFYQGKETARLCRAERRLWRQKTQVVFQSAQASLSPRLTVEKSLMEALKLARFGGGRAAREKKAEELLGAVSLGAQHLARFPGELSGGQRQRVVIARALAMEPDYLVADEPVSSLDAPVQAQIMALFEKLRKERGVGCLLIAHDLALVHQVCSRIGVLWQGRLVELGPAESLFCRPLHPYTRRLLASRLPLEPGAPLPEREALANCPPGGVWKQSGPGHFWLAPA